MSLNLTMFQQPSTTNDLSYPFNFSPLPPLPVQNTSMADTLSVSLSICLSLLIWANVSLIPTYRLS